MHRSAQGSWESRALTDLNMRWARWASTRKQEKPHSGSCRGKQAACSGMCRTLASFWQLQRGEYFFSHLSFWYLSFDKYGLNSACNLHNEPYVCNVWMYPNNFKSTKQIFHFIAKIPTGACVPKPNCKPLHTKNSNGNIGTAQTVAALLSSALISAVLHKSQLSCLSLLKAPMWIPDGSICANTW